MTVKNILLPKKRLIPLFVVCVLMAIALLYALFFNIHVAGLVADIFVPLVLVVVILTAWMSRKQLNSLYLMMNNAYIRYQEDVVTGMVTYEQYCQNFLMENTPSSTDYRYWKTQRVHTDAVNRDFIYLLLTKCREVVESAFAPAYPEHELPIDIFHKLYEEGKRLVKEAPVVPTEPAATPDTEQESPSISQSLAPTEERIEKEDPSMTQPIEPEKEASPFGLRLTNEDLSILVECINEIGIITTSDHKEITLEDLKEFFDCVTKPANESLVLCKNKEFAYLMTSLRAKRLISSQWQSLIYKSNLLVSDSTCKYVTRPAINAGVEKLKLGSPASSEITDKYISQILKNTK